MASGSGIIEYRGKRGTVWRIKYRDAEGRQVMETVGAERDGVTRKQAASELRERFVRVERKGYRRPRRLRGASTPTTWLEEGGAGGTGSLTPCAQPRAPSGDYGRSSVRLAAGGMRPRDVTAFVREALAEYAPATVNLDVNVLVDTFRQCDP